MTFGFWEIFIIAIIVLFIFGAKRLPEIGKSIGKGIREFKKATDELTKEELIEEDKHKKITKEENTTQKKD